MYLTEKQFWQSLTDDQKIFFFENYIWERSSLTDEQLQFGKEVFNKLDKAVHSSAYFNK